MPAPDVYDEGGIDPLRHAGEVRHSPDLTVLSNALNEQLREEYCETMIEQVPLHRDLIAAWTVASPGIPVRYLKRRG